MPLKSSFLALFSAPSPALLFREPALPDEAPRCHRLVSVLGSAPAPHDLESVSQLFGHDEALSELLEFYRRHESVALRLEGIGGEPEAPLFRLLDVASSRAFTSRFDSGNDLDWTIDLNTRRRVRALYRGPARWVAFALFESGPGCLVTFVEGAQVGEMFFLTPEPEFDIARPLARNFGELCDAIGQDLAAFLRRCGVRSPEGISPWKYESDLP